MATVNDVKDDPKYIVVHEHGFVGLVDHMGTDASIVQAARVSYGAGTKSVSDDRTLIRYLLRHKHTTPFEMCEVKFHMKLPIFVARQLIRHRTASVNEYSGRYSEMPNEFYVPDWDDVQPQSTDNKQGRSGQFVTATKHDVARTIQHCYDYCYGEYSGLIAGEYDTVDKGTGVSKELARVILPVGNYTEWYWKIDLHNLFHFLKLRLDPHAQKEIRDFADAIYRLLQPIFPVACEAFEDYINQAKTLSRMEVKLLKLLLYANTDFPPVNKEDLGKPFSEVGIKIVGSSLGMSKREIDEFVSDWLKK